MNQLSGFHLSCIAKAIRMPSGIEKRKTSANTSNVVTAPCNKLGNISSEYDKLKTPVCYLMLSSIAQTIYLKKMKL